MGRNLKHIVNAEGLETQEQIAYLQSQHCEEGQGSLLSPRLGAAPFGHLLETGIAACSQLKVRFGFAAPVGRFTRLLLTLTQDLRIIDYEQINSYDHGFVSSQWPQRRRTSALRVVLNAEHRNVAHNASRQRHHR